MSYTSILVHLDTSRAASGRLEFAFGLAHQFGARLQVLLTTERPATDSLYVSASSADFLIRHQKISAERIESLEQLFKTRAATTKIDCEWTITHDDANEAVPNAARLADLVIAGQPDPGDPESLRSAQFPGHLVLGSARPVLFVPYVGAGATVGTHVLVAWDGGREAARAVADAMPLLRRAKLASVVTIDALDDELPVSRLPGADIAAAIARHGVRVATLEMESVPVHAIGDTLLSRAADLGADLIVMGGYAHTRWRDLALGSATRAMLRAMTIPVLMSH